MAGIRLKVQTAVIAYEEDAPEKMVELLSFALQHPALHKAETGKQAQKLWEQVTAILPATVIAEASQTGREKDINAICLTAKTILVRSLQSQDIQESNSRA